MRTLWVSVLHIAAIGLQLPGDHDPGTGSERRFADGVSLLDGRPSADMHRTLRF